MKKILVLILLSMSISTFAQSYQDLIVQADELFNQHEYLKAKNLYYKATLQRQDAKAYIGLGNCYMAMNNNDSALVVLKKAYLLAPNNPEANFRLGLAYFTGQGNARKALAYFSNAADLAPDSTNYKVYQGLAYQALGNLDSAYAIYRKVMQTDTTNPYPYYFLADYMYEIDSLGAAYDLINTAIQKNPDNYNFYLLKASIEFKAHLYENALKTVEKGLAINPYSERLQLLKAKALYQLQRYNEAIPILEKLLLKDMTNLNVYYYLAWSYYYTAQYDKAIDIANEALKQNNQLEEFYQILSYAYIAKGDYTKAQKAADKLLQINPSQLAYNLKITAALYARTSPKVLTSDHKFVKLNALNLEYIKEQLSDETSPYYYDKLFSKFQSRPERLTLDEYLMVYLGYALKNQIQRTDQNSYIDAYRQGKYQECITKAQQAIDVYPFDQPAYLYLATAYRQTGDIANFLKYYTVYQGLMKSISASGDGMTKQTAYLITNKDDIYYVLDYTTGNPGRALSFGINSELVDGYEVYKVSVSFRPGQEMNVYFLMFR